MYELDSTPSSHLLLFLLCFLFKHRRTQPLHINIGILKFLNIKKSKTKTKRNVATNINRIFRKEKDFWWSRARKTWIYVSPREELITLEGSFRRVVFLLLIAGLVSRSKLYHLHFKSTISSPTSSFLLLPFRFFRLLQGKTNQAVRDKELVRRGRSPHIGSVEDVE